MKTEVEIGDLVQFSQSTTAVRKCWNHLPISGVDFKLWTTLPALLSDYTLDTIAMRLDRIDVTIPETKKFPMTVVDIITHCYSFSKVPAIKQAQTKKFAKILLFIDKGGMPEQHAFWMLYSDLEPFTGNSYLEDLKIKLKDKLSKHKMSNSEK